MYPSRMDLEAQPPLRLRNTLLDARTGNVCPKVHTCVERGNPLQVRDYGNMPHSGKTCQLNRSMQQYLIG